MVQCGNEISQHGLIEKGGPQATADVFQQLARAFGPQAKHHADLVRLQAFDEVQFERLALGLRPGAGRALHFIKQILGGDQLVRRSRAGISQNVPGFSQWRLECLFDHLQGLLRLVAGGGLSVLRQGTGGFQRHHFFRLLAESPAAAGQFLSREDVEPEQSADLGRLFFRGGEGPPGHFIHHGSRVNRSLGQFAQSDFMPEVTPHIAEQPGVMLGQQGTDDIPQLLRTAAGGLGFGREATRLAVMQLRAPGLALPEDLTAQLRLELGELPQEMFHGARQRGHGVGSSPFATEDVGRHPEDESGGEPRFLGVPLESDLEMDRIGWEMGEVPLQFGNGAPEALLNLFVGMKATGHEIPWKVGQGLHGLFGKAVQFGELTWVTTVPGTARGGTGSLAQGILRPTIR